MRSRRPLLRVRAPIVRSVLALLVLVALGYGDALDHARAQEASPPPPFATYLGAAGREDLVGVRALADGDLVVAGTVRPAATTEDPFPDRDAFVARLSPAGAVRWTLQVGGSLDDVCHGFDVDAAGGIVLGGETQSGDFPVTGGAVQPTFAGGVEGFVARVAADGSGLEWATFFGGAREEVVTAVAVGSDGRVSFAGRTISADLPLRNPARAAPSFGAVEPSPIPDAFAARLVADGSDLVFSTFLGGARLDTATAVAVDSAGQTLVAGTTGSDDFPTSAALQSARGGSDDGSTDAFLTRLNAAGAIVYSTYLGSAGFDAATGVAVADGGDAIVCGRTDHGSFPVFPVPADDGPIFGNDGAFQITKSLRTDAFVLRLAAAGDSLVFSSFLGGDGDDSAYGVALAPDGTIRVVGGTRSSDFPSGETAQPVVPGGGEDGFIAHVSADGRVLLSGQTLGGALDDRFLGVAAPGAEDAAAAGFTDSSDLPVFEAAQELPGGGRDGLVARYAGTPEGAPSDLVVTETDGVVRLTWTDTSDDELGFEVLRSIDGGAAEVVATPAPGTQVYEERVPAGAVLVTYRVRALLPGGLRAGSDVARLLRAPRAPSAPAVTSLGAARLHLAWDHDGVGAGAFVVERAVGAADYQEIATLTSSARTFDDRVLTSARPDSVVHYRVFARNDAGRSAALEFPVSGPTGMFSIEPRRGRLQMRPHGLDRFSARGAFADRGGFLPFDPTHDDLVLRAGPASAPFTLTIPAGDLGWNVKNHRLSWSSHRSLRPAVDGKLVFDLRRGRFHVTLRRFFFDGESENPVELSFAFGDEIGGDVREWKRRRAGRRYLVR